MKKKTKKWLCSVAAFGVLAVGSFLFGEYRDSSIQSVSLVEIPEYNGNAYVNVEDGKSDLEGEWKEGYDDFSSDNLGRCTEAKALVCKDSMPMDDRKDISSVTPTGWNNERYDSDLVEGGWVYNRCHLIGFQLTGENANQENLITGTRYLNIEGMLPFENMVADYVKETGNHVMYSVTPVYTENNLVADGVVMEAESVEDGGSGINFDVYCYNVQPGIEINYTTGETKIMK